MSKTNGLPVEVVGNHVSLEQEMNIREIVGKVKAIKKAPVKIENGFAVLDNYFQVPVGTYNVLKRNIEKGVSSLLIGPTGVGKCHTKGTEVLMYNGTIKKVEEIEEGDYLMGINSIPRKVLSLSRGQEMCYDVIPVKGEKWGCNENHILSLVNTETGSVVNISVGEYIKKSRNFKHLHKLYRSEVKTFGVYSEILIEPYFLGLWLGDGRNCEQTICTPDVEVVTYLKGYAEKSGSDYRVSMYPSDSKADNYSIVTARNKPNVVREGLKTYNLLHNKHIPYEYKTGSWDVRMNLLAGLIDSDGYLTQGCFEIVTKYDQLRDDILFLARSLGFGATSRVKEVMYKGELRNYNRLLITGDLSVVPTKIARKQATKRQQIKDVLRTGFTINPRGVEDYYGFTIDGDSLYLLGDFTVTHNSELGYCMAKVMGLPVTILDMGTMVDPIMGLVGTHSIKIKSGVTHSVFIKSRFSQLIQQPGIVILDEISR